MRQSHTQPHTVKGRSFIAGTLMAVTMAAAQIIGSAGAHAEGNDTLYLTPASGNYTVGQDIVVEVRENSNNEAVNAVQADLGYTTANLQFVRIDTAGTAFDVRAAESANNGTVQVARGSTSPVTGDRLVAKVVFKVISNGTGAIQMLNSSVVLSHTTNQNIVDTRGSSSFGLSTPGTPTPPTTTPPGPPGPPGSPGPAGPPGKPGIQYPVGQVPKPAPGAAPNVSITPSPSPATPAPTTTTVLPDESEIEVGEPQIVETTPSGDKRVTKVEYYINGKLKMTVTTPPYSYSVDTSNMRNGRYTLTTKTYYEDGKDDSTDAALNVRNPFGPAQLMLQLKHYAWLIILLAIIIGGVIWAMFFRNRGGGDEFGGGYGSDYGAGGGDGQDPGYPTFSPTPPPGQYGPQPPAGYDPNGQIPGQAPQPPYGPNPQNPNGPQNPYGGSF